MIPKFLKKKSLVAALALTMAAGALYSTADMNLSPVSVAHAQTKATVALPDFSKLVEENGKAVVRIETSKTMKRFNHPSFEGMPKDQLDQLRRFGFPMPFGQMPKAPGGKAPKSKGQGSGFIISPDGLIFTNHHVVDGADEVVVHLTDKREFKAKVLGSDPKTDIAVIKIDTTGLPTVKLGNSEKVRVGEWVAAIGAPFGLENTVTSGIVSAKSRNLPDDQFVPFIQTDAAVNPGNSGGPLFNMDGEVIGINSQIFSTSGGFMGLSFAIPIDLALQIKDELINNGKVSRGRLGVMIQGMTPELAKSFGLDKPKGALIAQVEKDSAAAKAGAQEGDIIIEFNGKPINESRELPRLVGNTKPGTPSDLKVLRDGKEVVLKVTLEELTDAKASQAKDSGSMKKGRLGVTIRPLNEAEKQKTDSGLVVVEVEEDSAASKAGIQPGDVIVLVAGKKVTSAEELQKAVGKAKDSLAILVERNGMRTFIPVKFDAKDAKEAPKTKKDSKESKK